MLRHIPGLVVQFKNRGELYMLLESYSRYS